MTHRPRREAETATLEGRDLTTPVVREALDFTDTFVYGLDAAGVITYANPAGSRVLELSDRSPVGEALHRFVHEDDRPRVQEAWRRLVAGAEEETTVECRLVGVGGQVTPMSHRLKARREGGSFVGAVGLGQSIRERKQLEEQLQQSQKLETIGMLTGGIAHDFNNMLAAILGYTELMIEDKRPEDPDYRALTYIQTSTERAAALVKQLLIFSRRSGAELKAIRLGNVVQETLAILQRTLPKTIRIAAYTEGEDDQVMGDAGRMQQAIMNLCLNARDAMPNGGELRIEVERVQVNAPMADAQTRMAPGDYVRVRVQDTGAGMSPEVVGRVWEPFFTTKPAGVGTGLGLSVVQGIVRLHRGHVQVESQVGQGTTFYLYVPAASTAELTETRALAEPPGGVETILVVDDEPVLLDLLYELLSAKGYKVIAAASGEEALEYVEEVGNRLDLIISDNMMPGMTGRELAREVLKRQPRMKILVCSGFAPTQESEIVDMDYATAYVQKPYQRRDLLARVREALDRQLSDKQPSP